MVLKSDSPQNIYSQPSVSVDAEPTETESHLYSTILFKGLEHLQILISQEGLGTKYPADTKG